MGVFILEHPVTDVALSDLKGQRALEKPADLSTRLKATVLPSSAIPFSMEVLSEGPNE
jgi:hypothetical protein